MTGSPPPVPTSARSRDSATPGHCSSVISTAWSSRRACHGELDVDVAHKETTHVVHDEGPIRQLAEGRGDTVDGRTVPRTPHRRDRHSELRRPACTWPRGPSSGDGSSAGLTPCRRHDSPQRSSTHGSFTPTWPSSAARSRSSTSGTRQRRWRPRTSPPTSAVHNGGEWRHRPRPDDTCRQRLRMMPTPSACQRELVDVVAIARRKAPPIEADEFRGRGRPYGRQRVGTRKERR